MKKIFAKIAIAGLIALGGIGSLSAPAFAGSLTLQVPSDQIINVQMRDGRYRDERDWGRHDRRRGVCSPRMATGKAFGMGLNRVRVVAVTPRRVVVEGRRHGRFITVAFVNVRGCPVRR